MKIRLVVDKKLTFFIIGIILVLVGFSVINAFGTSTPSTFGHSAGEIQNGTLQGDFTFSGNVNVLGTLTSLGNQGANIDFSVINGVNNQINSTLTTTWQQITLQPTPSSQTKGAIVYISKEGCSNGRIQLRTSSTNSDLGIHFGSANSGTIQGTGNLAIVPLENRVFDARMASDIVGGPSSCVISFTTIGHII